MPETTTDSEMDLFTRANARAMQERMEHGAKKFGALSWREEPYPDDRNLERLHRAIADLIHVVGFATPMPYEASKRAADVANQAFIYADPARYRRDEP